MVHDDLAKWCCIEASGKSNSSPGRTGCSSMSAVVSRYQKVYNAPGFYWASYYVVFRYVSQYKYPRGDASDKSDFSYDLPLYAHPTDTNGYREMRPLFSSLSLPPPSPLPPSNRPHVFHPSPRNWWNLGEIIVCGRTLSIDANEGFQGMIEWLARVPNNVADENSADRLTTLSCKLTCSSILFPPRIYHLLRLLEIRSENRSRSLIEQG